MSARQPQRERPAPGAEVQLCVWSGPALARYGFGVGHPFGNERLEVFWDGLRAAGLEARVRVCEPVQADDALLGRFHGGGYVGRVKALSRVGSGFLDYGDTPAYPGVYEAAATVAGSVVAAAEALLEGCCRRAFVPVAGLHHARRDRAGGFCVFNDCALAIVTLLEVHGLERVAYVDIDAHHGDGVYYGFEDDPRVIIADFHEDGRYLYPGTGFAHERGSGAAAGTKLNIPLPPGAGDELFLARWTEVEALLARYPPEFILFQCGADSLGGDPLTHLDLTVAAHAHAARRLCAIADAHCGGRVLALGGGGYDHANMARAWTAVVSALLEPPTT